MDGYIVVTLDCNHKCIFCSVEKTEDYISKELFEKKVDEFISKGADMFVLTGGEPAMHPEIVELAQMLRAKAPKAQVRMITNGTKLTEELILKLKGYVDKFVFSIHHYDAEAEMEINGADEIELPTVFQNMAFAHKHGFEVNMNTTIIEKNYMVLPQIIKEASKHSKINTWTMNFVDPASNDPEIMKSIRKNVVPRYSLAEPYLYNAAKEAERHETTLRIERVPLCYLKDFEYYSSEALRASGVEYYETKFLDREQSYGEFEYVKNPEICENCFFTSLCPGVKQSYLNVYDVKELNPVFSDPLAASVRIKEKSNFVDDGFLVNVNPKDTYSSVLKLVNQFGGNKRFFNNKKIFFLADESEFSKDTRACITRDYPKLVFDFSNKKEHFYRPFNRAVKDMFFNSGLKSSFVAINLSIIQGSPRFLYTLDHLVKANPFKEVFDEFANKPGIDLDELFLDLLSFVSPKFRLSFVYDPSARQMFGCLDPFVVELALFQEGYKENQKVLEKAQKRGFFNTRFKIIGI